MSKGAKKNIKKKKKRFDRYYAPTPVPFTRANQLELSRFSQLILHYWLCNRNRKSMLGLIIGRTGNATLWQLATWNPLWEIKSHWNNDLAYSMYCCSLMLVCTQYKKSWSIIQQSFSSTENTAGWVHLHPTPASFRSYLRHSTGQWPQQAICVANNKSFNKRKLSWSHPQLFETGLKLSMTFNQKNWEWVK